MGDERLSLHEYIDIVGEGAVAYMEHTVRFDAEAAADRSLELVGTWYTMGSTGRWPQVVNLWEIIDGWSGWRRLMESTNLGRTDNPALNAWWREALKSRSGGFDRLLRAAPGCPTLVELREQGVAGTVFVHELSEVPQGGALEYLDMVADRRVPFMREHNHELVGLYEVLMADSEVITVWATDPAGCESLMRAVEEASDPQLEAWTIHRRGLTTRWREELMTPGPGSPLARGSID